MNLTGHALYDFKDEVHKQALTSVVRSLDSAYPSLPGGVGETDIRS